MIRSRAILLTAVALGATLFAIAVFAAPPTAIDQTVPSETGYLDIPVDGMVALPSARFLTTELIEPVRNVQPVAVDPTPGDPYDDVTQNYRRLHSMQDQIGGARRYRLEARVTAAQPNIDLFVGRDLDSDLMPDAGEELCRSTSAGSFEQCVATLPLDGGFTFWVMVQNTGAAAQPVTVESSLLDLCTDPICGDPGNRARFVATGPGMVPADAAFTIRLEYDDSVGFTKGRVRLGMLSIQYVPGTTVAEVPVRLTRTGVTQAPFALAHGRSRRIALTTGAENEQLFVDIPPGINDVWFRTSEHSDGAALSLYVARVDSIPSGPLVGTAPPRDAPGVLSTSSVGAGGQQIHILNPAPGRYFVTPVNDGVGTESMAVTVTMYGETKPRIRRGSYFNPERGGHGIFLYESGDDVAMLWYTYLQDGTPTWYYAQGGAAFERRAWDARVYRAAWHGFDRTLTDVGSVIVTAMNEDDVTLSYNIDGFTGTETMTKWLTGCPQHAGQALNVSSHWYEAAAPGYGYSVQVHPDYEFFATFAYDGHGVPRFLAAERGGPFDGDDTTLPLYQLAGFAPLGPYMPPTRTVVGSLGRTYGVSTIEQIGTNATFVNGLPGSWTRSANVTRLSDFSQGCAP